MCIICIRRCDVYIYLAIQTVNKKEIVEKRKDDRIQE